MRHTTVFKKLATTGLLVASLNSLSADQPIMNMMPRWSGGYGLQVLTEHIHRSDLKQGGDVVGRGFTEDITRLHLQGVYTWDKSMRITVKLPYTLDARREVLGPDDTKVVQHDAGVGDLTVALPFKKYFNLDRRTANWSLTPQVRIPLGSKDGGYAVADRVWGSGLSLGYETETYHWFCATSLDVWIFEAPEPAEWQLSLDLGWNARDNMQLLWEIDLLRDDEEAFVVSAGPAIYWRWSDLIHSRIEWRHDFVSRVSAHEADHGNGDRIRVGIGVVF